MNFQSGRASASRHGSGTGDAIRISGLRVERGARVVLDDFDLTVRPGTLTGLLGPSGSGKSTLMRAIVGVQQMRRAGGRARPAGRIAAVRHRVGYLTQSPSVYARPDGPGEPSVLRRCARRDTAAVDRTIEQVDLASHADDLVDSLSGGQESRASLAAALLGEPELLVLDEPTVGLDPVLRRDLWDVVHGARRRGRHAARLQPRHGRGRALRPRLLLLREGRCSPTTRLPELLARTGAADAEHAFLHLIDQGAAP